MDRRAVQVGVLVALASGLLLTVPTGRLHQDPEHYSPPAAYHDAIGGSLTPAAVRTGIVLALLLGLIAYLAVRAHHVRKALAAPTARTY